MVALPEGWGDADMAEPWELAAATSASALLQLTGHVVPGGCVWQRGAVTGQHAVTVLQWLVADEIVQMRAGRNAALLAAWRGVARGEAAVDAAYAPAVRPFIRPSFGLPTSPPASATHAMGYVAQVLWYLVARDAPAQGRYALAITPPDPAVTAPGGDGFVSFTTSDPTEFHFRLWEIKKTDHAASVSSTAGRAMDQLSEKAAEYLAKKVSESPNHEPPYGDFLAELVDLWQTANPRSGLGVAVATETPGLPTQCFTTMHQRFPQLSAADQLEGLLVGLGNLEAFTVAVRGLLWTAL